MEEITSESHHLFINAHGYNAYNWHIPATYIFWYLYIKSSNVNMFVTEHCWSPAKLLKAVKPEFKATDKHETFSFTKMQKKKLKIITPSLLSKCSHLPNMLLYNIYKIKGYLSIQAI